jgi:hypothetical protein
MTAYNAAYSPLVDPNGANYQSGATQGFSDGSVAGNHDGQIAIADSEYVQGYDSTYDSSYDSQYQIQYNNYFYSGYNDGYNVGYDAGFAAAPCIQAEAVKGAAGAQISSSLASPRLVGVSNKTTGVLTTQERGILTNLVAAKDKSGKTLPIRQLTTHPDPDTNKATSKNPQNVPAAETQFFDTLNTKMQNERASLKTLNQQTLELTKGISKSAVSF